MLLVSNQNSPKCQIVSTASKPRHAGPVSREPKISPCFERQRLFSFLRWPTPRCARCCVARPRLREGEENRPDQRETDAMRGGDTPVPRRTARVGEHATDSPLSRLSRLLLRVPTANLFFFSWTTCPRLERDPPRKTERKSCSCDAVGFAGVRTHLRHHLRRPCLRSKPSLRKLAEPKRRQSRSADAHEHHRNRSRRCAPPAALPPPLPLFFYYYYSLRTKIIRNSTG